MGQPDELEEFQVCTECFRELKRDWEKRDGICEQCQSAMECFSEEDYEVYH